MRSPGNETIAAVATGAGCGIGIVRVSGPEALAVGARIFRCRGGRPLEAVPPLSLALGIVVDPASGEQLDEAFAVHMCAGRSYTGEQTVEIQCHGGRGVLDAVLQAALDAGARPAAPGEFTKRAFLSGRIDLSQAEAVAELIGASTEGARQAALTRLNGGVGERARFLRARLLDQVAAIEAILDLGDEQAGEGVPQGAVIESLARELHELIELGESQNRRPAGPRVVIAGSVNSGKSSLFNVLCNSTRSIVSPIPGTTRDYIEEHFCIDGNLVTLVDTAGLRDARDPIEQEGVRRSRRQLLDADLLILTVDASLPLDPSDCGLIEDFRERLPLIVLTKADLPARIAGGQFQERFPELPIVSLSTVDGRGSAELARAIARRCRDDAAPGEAAVPNLRHLESLRAAAVSLDKAAILLSRPETALDMASTELRWAVDSLGEITGETAGEEILDRIFSRFCLGK